METSKIEQQVYESLIQQIFKSELKKHTGDTVFTADLLENEKFINDVTDRIYEVLSGEVVYEVSDPVSMENGGTQFTIKGRRLKPEYIEKVFDFTLDVAARDGSQQKTPE